MIACDYHGNESLVRAQYRVTYTFTPARSGHMQRHNVHDACTEHLDEAVTRSYHHLDNGASIDIRIEKLDKP